MMARSIHIPLWPLRQVISHTTEPASPHQYERTDGHRSKAIGFVHLGDGCGFSQRSMHVNEAFSRGYGSGF